MGLSTFLRQQRPLRVRGVAAPTGVIGEAAMAQVADELRALGFDVYRVHADSLYFLVDSLEQAYRLHVAIVEASEQTGLWCFYAFFPACNGRFLGKEHAGRLAFVIEQPAGPMQTGDIQDALRNLLSCLQRLRQSPNGPWPFAASVGFPVIQVGAQ